MSTAERHLRDATEEDYEPFLRLFLELGVPEGPPSREAFCERFLRHTYFATDTDGALLGYALGRAMGERWYVMNVVTAPEARGRGVGRLLMQEQERRARAAGLARWALSVKRDNAVARRLYERCGMQVRCEATALRLPWASVQTLEASPEHAPGPPPPALDEATEAALRLARGQLASERAREGRVLLGLLALERVVAVASFDPAFPGAVPFRAEHPRWARGLLEALRPQARPEHDYLRLVVEDDAALLDALCRAGAQVQLELFIMEGALG